MFIQTLQRLVFNPVNKIAEFHNTIGSTPDRGRKIESQFGRIAFLEIGHEIISTVILSLSVVKRLAKVCAQNKNWLTAKMTNPVWESVIRLINFHDKPLTVLTGPQNSR